jgi:hypothetical protein
MVSSDSQGGSPVRNPPPCFHHDADDPVAENLEAGESRKVRPDERREAREVARWPAKVPGHGCENRNLERIADHGQSHREDQVAQRRLCHAVLDQHDL